MSPGPQRLRGAGAKTTCPVSGRPSLAKARAGDRYQIERQGCSCLDPDSSSKQPVFNRTVGLRDTWAKIAQKDRTSNSGG